MADQPDYPTSCLNCGAPLEVVALDAQTAPWACFLCGLGFWPAELRAAADAENTLAWDATLAGFPSTSEYHALQETLVEEHAAARARGTSLLPEQIDRLDVPVLAHWERRKSLDPEFRRHVRAALRRKRLAEAP